ncbi:lysozyme inhibitor LprI family protein [Silvibacterium dinghuense]|uniref:Lysozyme inhibitor LprI N-terminal domain-containing protein n=1 Tax=Silvibacterium dinghuense TaxID=1560006 RepID=A0A4Q1S982_9BACT|nr:lysozyme inhibitor LprI family protein [Silvibacterium dinghuense]RXS93246.1 hypothetical protein ESZ00_17935 [Silvibacterium dinghuense]GGH04259.1 hypothetical protein GCM10011586_20290 [Silvibacterium dinghuense]
MKSLFFVFVLSLPLLGQQAVQLSLAPIRAEAKMAFTAEMDRAAKGDCPNQVTSAEIDACYKTALLQSRSNLNAFRSAIRMSIQARERLFPPLMLKDFEASEQAWDRYSATQTQVTADMVDNPEDKSSSAAATEIGLIRSHLRDLDKIYNILLHNNCGACLADQ